MFGRSTRTAVVGVVALALLLGVSVDTATAAPPPIIPHMDPLAAIAQMTRRPAPAQPATTNAPTSPPAPSAPSATVMAAAMPLGRPQTDDERRAAFEEYREMLARKHATAREERLNAQYPHAGAWEMIADVEYGVRVAPDSPAPPSPLVPTPTPTPAPPKPTPSPPFVTQPIKPVTQAGLPLPPSVQQTPPVVAAPTPVIVPKPASPTSAAPVVVAPTSTSSATPTPGTPTPPTTPATPTPTTGGSVPLRPVPVWSSIRGRFAEWADRLRAVRDKWFAAHPRPHEQAAIPTAAPSAPKLTPSSSSGSGSSEQPHHHGKPFLNGDQVIHEIRRFNTIIAANKAKRAADDAKTEHDAHAAMAAMAATPPSDHHPSSSSTVVESVALAKAAFAAANPPKQHADAAAAATHPPTPLSDTREHNRGFHRHTRHHHSVRFGDAANTKPNPNEPVQFALKFVGRCETKPNDTQTAEAAEDDDTHAHGKRQRGKEVPHCKLRATSQELVTRIHPRNGVDMAVYKLFGAQAILEVFNVEVLSETAFTASGNVSFGSTRHKPHVLRFATAGPARVYKLKDGERSFTAQFQVHGGTTKDGDKTPKFKAEGGESDGDGENAFDGATGTLTMNGRLMSPDRVEALVTGVIFKPAAVSIHARRWRMHKPTPHRVPLHRVAPHRIPPPPPPKPAPTTTPDDDDDDDDDHEEDNNKSIKPKPNPKQRVIHLRR